MKILVTGGSGFIGSALIRTAIQRKFSVINIDSLTYASCSASLASVENNSDYTFEKADICDRQSLDLIFTKYSPDVVMHLAAESHVDRSINNPEKFIETNINGTLNMLEASRSYWYSQGEPSSFRFHHVSTDEVYGSLPNDINIKFTEETPYDPRSPYSASKASSDHLVRAWYETYNLPILITNCSNNYGHYQFPEKLIPVIIINAIAENLLPIYGNGENIRDWLYVDDHVDALLLVLQKGKIGRSYNIGGQNERTNLSIVHSICSILNRLMPRDNGVYEDLISYVADRPGHDARYSIDPRRIREELNWTPSLTLEEGLEKTVQWYLDNMDWWKPLLLKSRIQDRLGKKL